MVGAGRSEVMKSIFGLMPKVQEIYIWRVKVTINSPIDAMKNGIALVRKIVNSKVYIWYKVSGLIQR